jgi:hypothetical protein
MLGLVGTLVEAVCFVTQAPGEAAEISVDPGSGT